MQKIKRTLLKSPLLTVASICFIIASSIFLFSGSGTSDVKGIAKKVILPIETIKPSPTKIKKNTLLTQEQPAVIRSSVSPTVSSPTSASNNQQNPTATNTPAPKGENNTAAATFHVALSINGASVGEVAITQDANQCDVLTKAKEQGRIDSLLMKYDNSLGTNGVYQINGIGRENAIWWIYKINGTSPTQGCSYVKAKDGDLVEWEYKG
jgi:hypothetical protein